MNAQDQLTLAAARMARSPAFQEWKELLIAFDAYANQKREDLVKSPLEQIQVAQGRAQECATMQRLFAGAVAAADRRAERTGGVITNPPALT